MDDIFCHAIWCDRVRPRLGAEILMQPFERDLRTGHALAPIRPIIVQKHFRKLAQRRLLDLRPDRFALRYRDVTFLEQPNSVGALLAPAALTIALAVDAILNPPNLAAQISSAESTLFAAIHC
jgi:hypothetical protein